MKLLNQMVPAIRIKRMIDDRLEAVTQQYHYAVAEDGKVKAETLAETKWQLAELKMQFVELLSDLADDDLNKQPGGDPYWANVSALLHFDGGAGRMDCGSCGPMVNHPINSTGYKEAAEPWNRRQQLAALKEENERMKARRFKCLMCQDSGGVVNYFDGAPESSQPCPNCALAPTDNGIEELDSLCQKFNSGEIDLTALVCRIWNAGSSESHKHQNAANRLVLEITRLKARVAELEKASK